MVIVFIIFILTLSIFGVIVGIIRKNLTKKGVYQVYWTTKNGLINLRSHEGQFRIQADTIEVAKTYGAKKLQEKYGDKPWFSEIRLAVRGREEKSIFAGEGWDLLTELLDR